MLRRLCLTLALLLAAVQLKSPAAAEEKAAPVLRALLVTCDRFVSQMETTPAAQQNAVLMKSLLETDGRGYEVIRTECDSLASVDAFSTAVQETFGEAKEEDISLLYISSHGVYTANRSNLTASVLLSDGVTEERLTARVLADILARIPGTKVLLLDACHSGAFIGKGLSDFARENPFAGEGFEVLCSAGGSEESWYWRADDGTALNGAGYFTSILSSAFSKGGRLSADQDGDNALSMRETRQYLLDHYAASTPQIYPENSSFVLYQPPQEGEESTGAISYVSFDNTVFSGAVAQLSFSFRLTRPAEVSYQLVYDQQGKWDFAHAAVIADGLAGPDAVLAPGIYRRSINLRLGDEEQDVSGYLMLQIFTREEGRVDLHESRLLRVYPAQGDVALEVRAAASFVPQRGEELSVRVYHDVPCSLTVTVQNAQGRTIRYLSMETPSRPQRLTPEGTSLYWDGKMDDGSDAPAGRYLIRVQTAVAGVVYYAYSDSFMLYEEKVSGQEETWRGNPFPANTTPLADLPVALSGSRAANL